VAVVLLGSLIDGLGGVPLVVRGVLSAGGGVRVPALRRRAVQLPELLVLVPGQLRQPELHLPPSRELSTPGYLVKFHLKHARNSMKGACSMVALGLW
jgi:hypothetical protein